MPRFTILLHETPRDYPRPCHWDLLLDRGEHLRAWALAQPPTVDRTVEADELPPHRKAYLDYEGPVSDNRGVVTQLDTGQYTLDVDEPNTIEGELMGGDLNGRFSLTRREDNSTTWRFHLFSSTSERGM
jgi:hypothetical protein